MSDACGCDEVEVALVRVSSNPPGLDALAYRVGTHGAFKAAMLRALGGDSALRRLGTRDDGDPIIALLDSYAGMLDVLTFYTERIANEGFLRTATERLSVLELARAIGYELGSGVAAGTALAFTLSEPAQITPPPDADVPVAAYALTTPPSVTIPVGTKAQSVPGQDGVPHVFETVAEIEARPEWNAMRVPATEPVAVVGARLYLAGTSTALDVGDPLLIGDDAAGGGGWLLRRVAALRTVERTGMVPAHTVVTVEQPLGRSAVAMPENPRVYALRTRAAIFGHNAMPWATLPAALRVGGMVSEPDGGETWVPGPYAGRQDSWADATFPAETTHVFLDRTHPGIIPGSLLVMTTPAHAEVFEVTDVAEVTRADYLLQAKVTRLTLSGEHIEHFSPRTTSVYGRPELLPPARRPAETPVCGHTVTLAEPATGLTLGRLVAVRGTRVDPATNTSATASEVHEIAAVVDGEATTLVLTADLAHEYLPHTVRINANVAPATHGESRTEVLGGGDGSMPFQSFTLADKPLTYVSAAVPSGARSTLEVRVDRVAWTEVGSLYGQRPDARVFVTRRADDGTVTVRFGDGVTGARLPTGRDNVVARYRVGTGLGGDMAAGRISLPLSRPLGVQGVINPVPASGADDPERLDRARRNAPTTVRTLDRIVSLRDFEYFAGSFLGIGKAAAAVAWDGERQVVQLVVATAAGESVPPGSDLHRNLLAGIDAARHADHQVRVVPYEPRPFAVDLQVAVAPDRLVEDVFTAVRAALSAAFSFSARGFGQRVTASEVLAVVQRVAGVRGAVLAALHFAGTRVVRSTLLPAQPEHLLTLADADITVTELGEPLR